MFAALTGVNAIDEGDMFLIWNTITIFFRVELVGEDCCDLPALTALFVCNTDLTITEEEPDKFLECVAGDYGTIPGHFHFTADEGRELNCAGMEDNFHILTHASREACKIGYKLNSDDAL